MQLLLYLFSNFSTSLLKFLNFSISLSSFKFSFNSKDLFVVINGSCDAEKRFIEKYSEYKKYTPLEYKDNTINYNTKLFRVLLDIIKKYFNSVDESVILKYSLFSSKISCHDDFCYELLRKIENRLKISLQPYQTFSKLDFVSVFSLYKRLLETNITEGVY